MFTSQSHADLVADACETIEEAEDDILLISVKYDSQSVRDNLWKIAQQAMHMAFISRIVSNTRASDILPLCDNPDIADIEIIAWSEKDSVLHRLLEIYRIHHYVIGGRFDVSAVNFSQGVRYSALGKNISGERTVMEALDAVSSRAAPVFVAAGNAGTLGINGYSKGSFIFPVAASQNNGHSLYPQTSRPDSSTDPRQLYLFADGAPRATKSTYDNLPDNCNSQRHLTIGQMLLPEESEIKIGGSSFSTFSATSSACLVHQYLQVAEFYLSASKPVGEVRAEPFISYYIDNPIEPTCEALTNRLADRRNKFVPVYDISIQAKTRIQNFFFGNTVEFNLNYSTPLLKAFFRSMQPTRLAADFPGHQIFVSQNTVSENLKSMTMGNWVAVAANHESLYYQQWQDEAQSDVEPMIDSKTVDRMAEYCRTGSLFIVLPDITSGEF